MTFTAADAEPMMMLKDIELMRREIAQIQSRIIDFTKYKESQDYMNMYLIVLISLYGIIIICNIFSINSESEMHYNCTC